jgi:activating signal cointegrator complex subunit 1
MATRRLFPALSHKPTQVVTSPSTGMSSKRHHTARRDLDLSSTNGSQQRRQARRPQHNPRPTHFLALPIGHHPELRNAIAALTSSWLAHEPPIAGLDPSIVVHPRRLHLTLGVMALDPNHNHNPSSEGQGRDLAGARALLASLAPRIRAVLAQSPLCVPLGRLVSMQTDPERAHVLYAEPDLRPPDGQRLRAVCGACCFLQGHHLSFSQLPYAPKEDFFFDQIFLLDLVHGAFMEAGFLTDVRRPLKVRLPAPAFMIHSSNPYANYYYFGHERLQLHCTLLNTSHRRTPGQRGRGPDGGAGRIPFSFAAFPRASSDEDSKSLGTWTVDELQICELGSWAPDEAYVRVAGCDLRPGTA